VGYTKQARDSDHLFFSPTHSPPLLKFGLIWSSQFCWLCTSLIYSAIAHNEEYRLPTVKLLISFRVLGSNPVRIVMPQHKIPARDWSKLHHLMLTNMHCCLCSGARALSTGQHWSCHSFSQLFTCCFVALFGFEI